MSARTVICSRCADEAEDLLGVAEPLCLECLGAIIGATWHLFEPHSCVLTDAGDVVCGSCGADHVFCMCGRMNMELVAAHRAVLRTSRPTSELLGRVRHAAQLGLLSEAEARSSRHRILEGLSAAFNTSVEMSTTFAASVELVSRPVALGGRARLRSPRYTRVRAAHGQLVHLLDHDGGGLCGIARRRPMSVTSWTGPVCRRCEAAASVGAR